MREGKKRRKRGQCEGKEREKRGEGREGQEGGAKEKDRRKEEIK